ITFSLGFASFRPVANGMARPCVVWNESSFTYPATRPVQPMPLTTATESRSSLDTRYAGCDRYGGTARQGSGRSSGGLQYGGEDVVRAVYAASSMRHVYDAALAAGGAFDFADHLTEIQLGNDQSFGGAGECGDLLIGEGPCGDQAKLADLQAARATEYDGPLCYSRRDAVRDDDDIGVGSGFLFEQGDTGYRAADLILQAADQLVLSLGSHVGIAALVVGETGHVKVVALPGGSEVGNHVTVGAIGQIGAGQAARVPAWSYFDLIGRRDDHLLGHVA